MSTTMTEPIFLNDFHRRLHDYCTRTKTQDQAHNCLISYSLALLFHGGLFALAVYVHFLPEDACKDATETLKMALVSGSMFLFFVFDFSFFIKLKTSEWRGIPIVAKIAVNQAIMFLLRNKMVDVLEYAPKTCLTIVIWLFILCHGWVVGNFNILIIVSSYKYIKEAVTSWYAPGTSVETQMLLEKGNLLERGDAKDGALSNTASNMA